MYSSAFRSLALVLALCTFGAESNSVCQAGDIGIGSPQLCQLCNSWGEDAPCGQLYQELFDDQCVSHDVSTEETYCDGGWDIGSEVQCDDDHNVTWVRRGEWTGRLTMMVY
jgi:hypothetical protein